ncbi:hypothetical protein J5N97_015476 [Dioscorea zingiberensis]|uniref:MATH domain-containing protein n=1 Tax=Dioscorea zingiberensis TaxID=325984 RepID=A0A9D5CVZ1_9LILI|nr:hypothetical protein J5N97_015476 [Dioscorea zingiberensis]
MAKCYILFVIWPHWSNGSFLLRIVNGSWILFLEIITPYSGFLLIGALGKRESGLNLQKKSMGNTKSVFRRSAHKNEKKKMKKKEPITSTEDFHFNFIWCIENFSQLPDRKGLKYESGDFYAFDCWWKLHLVKDGTDHLGLYLYMASAPLNLRFAEFSVKFKLSVLDQIGENHRTRTGNGILAVFKTWGFKNLIKLEELSEANDSYLVDDTCEFELEIISVTPIKRKIETLVVQVQEPQKHRWIISNFSQLPRTSPVTESFTLFDIMWKLELFPNGRAEYHRNISLYLIYESSTPHPSVEYTISVIDQKNGEDKKMTACTVFRIKSQGWGFANFLAISDLRDPAKGYIVDDTCQIELEIKLLGFVDT